MTVVILGEAEREFTESGPLLRSEGSRSRKALPHGSRRRSRLDRGGIRSYRAYERKVIGGGISRRFRITSRISFAERRSPLSRSRTDIDARSSGSVERRTRVANAVCSEADKFRGSSAIGYDSWL